MRHNRAGEKFSSEVQAMQDARIAPIEMRFDPITSAVDGLIALGCGSEIGHSSRDVVDVTKQPVGDAADPVRGEKERMTGKDLNQGVETPIDPLAQFS